MMLHTGSMLDNRMAAAHCVEASFSCPFFGQASVANAGIIALGTMFMVSIFISLALVIPFLLALLIGLGLTSTAPEEHPDLV